MQNHLKMDQYPSASLSKTSQDLTLTVMGTGVPLAMHLY